MKYNHHIMDNFSWQQLLCFILAIFFPLLSSCGKKEYSLVAEMSQRGSTVAFVGAHPDDELTATSLLYRACVEGLADCYLVIFTRGEGGQCALPEGCNPDLPTVRARELRQSAGILNAKVVQGDFSNSPTSTTPVGDVISRWGQQEALNFLSDNLNIIKPDYIITFDPDSGYTLHAEHRAAGYLVTELYEKTGNGSRLFYIINPLRGRILSMTEKQTGIIFIYLLEYYPHVIEVWNVYRSQHDWLLQTAVDTPDMWEFVYLKEHLLQQ